MVVIVCVGACNPYKNTDYIESMQHLKQVQATCDWVRGEQEDQEAAVSVKIDPSSLQGHIQKGSCYYSLVHDDMKVDDVVTFPAGKSSHVLIYSCQLMNIVNSEKGLFLFGPYRLISIDRQTKSCTIQPLRDE